VTPRRDELFEAFYRENGRDPPPSAESARWMQLSISALRLETQNHESAKGRKREMDADWMYIALVFHAPSDFVLSYFRAFVILPFGLNCRGREGHLDPAILIESA
jgi:hypothetical protein